MSNSKSAVSKQAFVSTTLVKLETLSNMRDGWERDLFNRSNESLYNLLSECLDMFYNIKGMTGEKELVEAIKVSLKASGFKPQTNSSVLGLIVRFVFKNDRRRAYAYARALRIAVAKKIDKSQFAEWVNKVGGIEEVKENLTKTPIALHKQTRLLEVTDQVTSALSVRLNAPLAVLPASALLESVADTKEYTLMLGKTLPSGETKILAVVPNATQAMLNQAIKKIAEFEVLQQDAEKNKLPNHVADTAVTDAVSAANQSPFFINHAAMLLAA